MRWILCMAAAAALAACSRDAAPRTPDSPPENPEPAPADLAELDAISGADPIYTAPSGARPAVARTDTATVIAKLASRGDRMPHCGILYAIEGMQFEVVDVERGAVGAKRLSVAVGCPEMPPGGHIESFDVGATYRLKLSQDYPDRVRSPAIDSADYWLESIEPAP
jgi:hypothetical protein